MVVVSYYCTSCKVYMDKHKRIPSKSERRDWTGQTGEGTWLSTKIELCSALHFVLLLSISAWLHRYLSKCLTLRVTTTRVPISSRRAVRNVIPSKLRVPIKSDPTYMGELLANTERHGEMCSHICALVSSVVILERRKAIPTLPLI
jgi:hypothetical protein